MTKLTVSLVLAAAIFALSGALFFVASTMRKPGPASASPPPTANPAMTQIEGRVQGLAERLERLENALTVLNRPPAEAAPAAVAEAADAPEEPAAGEATAEGVEERQLLASILRGEGSGGLRNYVNKVIREERDDRHRRDMEKFAEQQKEMEELNKGPYGKFNFRINSLAKRLGLSERQKEQYYALLADYAARFEEARKNVNREDPEDYKAYRERKKQMTDDFDTLIVQTLNPAQAEEYGKLADFEKSPDPKTIEGADTIRIALPPGGEGAGGDAVFFTSEVMPRGSPGPAAAGAAGEVIHKVVPPPSK